MTRPRSSSIASRSPRSASARFRSSQAAGAFVAIVVGEIVWGIGVGWLMLRLRRWVGDPRIEITLSVLTPFLAYWPPEQLGGSGVLATVATGLYISWNGLRLISAATRLQGIFFWDFLLYLIEGMVFLVTGLQARSVIAGISGYSVSQLAISAAGRQRRRHRRALRLDVSLDLSAALARPGDPPQGSRRRPGNGRSRWRSPACAASSRWSAALAIPFTIAERRSRFPTATSSCS